MNKPLLKRDALYMMNMIIGLGLVMTSESILAMAVGMFFAISAAAALIFSDSL